MARFAQVRLPKSALWEHAVTANRSLACLNHRGLRYHRTSGNDWPKRSGGIHLTTTGTRVNHLGAKACAGSAASSGDRTNKRTRTRDAAVTSRIMASVKGKDSRAERSLRTALYARGVRYRKHYRRLLGTPDIAVPWAKVAVFVDGDFWHGNAWKLRGLPDLAAQFPNRTEFWVAKITRNMERDRLYTEQLEAQGWRVLRYWESDILRDADRVAAEIAGLLDGLRTS